MTHKQTVYAQALMDVWCSFDHMYFRKDVDESVWGSNFEDGTYSIVHNSKGWFYRDPATGVDYPAESSKCLAYLAGVFVSQRVNPEDLTIKQNNMKRELSEEYPEYEWPWTSKESA